MTGSDWPNVGNNDYGTKTLVEFLLIRERQTLDDMETWLYLYRWTSGDVWWPEVLDTGFGQTILGEPDYLGQRRGSYCHRRDLKLHRNDGTTCLRVVGSVTGTNWSEYLVRELDIVSNLDFDRIIR